MSKPPERHWSRFSQSLTIMLVIFILLLSEIVGGNFVREEQISTLEQKCPNYKRCSAKDVNNSTDLTSSCCLPCSCDENTCSVLNNCCPDLEVTNNGPDSQNSLQQSCMPTYTSLEKMLGISNVRLGVLMVKDCLPGKSSTKCSSPDQLIIEEIIPVSSRVSGVTYRNKFCAECNNITSDVMLPWKSYVTCSELSVMKADDLLFPASVQKMYKYTAEAGKQDCGFDFLPPVNFTIPLPLCFLNETLVSSCPAGYTDIDVVNTCRALYLPYIKTFNGTSVFYQNYFCSICNENSAGDAQICPKQTEITLYEDNDFVVEVNSFGKQDSDFMLPWYPTDLTPSAFIPVGVSCGEMTTFDPFQEKCREWFCPSDRQAVNGVCVPNIIDIVNATFNIALKIKPDQLTLETFIASNKTILTNKVLDNMFGKDAHTSKKIIILAEKSDSTYLFVSVLVTVDSESVHKTSLYDPLTYGKDMTLAINEDEAVTVNVDLAIGLKIELTTFPLSDIVVIDLIEYIALDNVYRVNISEIEDSFRFTTITHLAFCSQFMLHRSEIRDYIDVVDIRVSDTRIHIGEFSRTSRFDTVHICVSDYLRHAQRFLDEKYKGTTFSPQAILSVVCNLLSIAGLSFTIVTYVIFDELRSIPGKNNMMLALHLLIAQCLYQFGMDQTHIKSLCIVLGICIHMFWLIAIFWMNACTLHMFRTFVTGQSYRSVRACDPQVLCYAMYCYAIAVAMVAINIGVSMYKSNGKEVGYGGRVCYISDPIMVGWVFALPVGVIIILNMGFFFAVVYQISASTMRRRGKSTDRANTVIYMKLSSLTGVTWIFGYLYLWTDFAPLEYIFIVLNAGQGVLIFISFICTQRITKLYWNLLRKNCLTARAYACVCCVRKSYESEGNGVEMMTAKVQMSLTAETTTKKRKSAKPKRVLKLEGANFGSKSDSVCENVTKPGDTSSETVNKSIRQDKENSTSNVYPEMSECDKNGDITGKPEQNGKTTVFVSTIEVQNIDIGQSVNTDIP